MRRPTRNQFNSWQDAVEYAHWLNFTNRRFKGAPIYGVDIINPVTWSVVEASPETGEYLPTDEDIDFTVDRITTIHKAYDPLDHWESVFELFSIADGELLRYILYMELPLERIIKCELAARGHDKDNKWVGFERAREIWLESTEDE